MSKTIWKTFSTMQNPLSQNPQHRQARQLRERQWAAGISFGLPFLFLLVTLLLQKFADKSLSFHPNLQKSCSLNMFLPLFLFFHLPLLLLLLLNLVFYALLVFKFSCGIWSSSIPDDSNSINWRNFKVVLELFVFMGIYWLPESVGFFIHWFDSKNWNHPAVTFFQHLNQLTGVMILAAFVSKRKNRELVQDMLLLNQRDVEYPSGSTMETNTNTTTISKL